jgi:hypothetical protein
MNQDKYSAVWLSYSSINDYLNCPRAYYLKNIYRDPASGNKIQIVNPALSLGSAVHEVIEQLSNLPLKERFKEPFTVMLSRIWPRFSGKQGGFVDKEAEQRYHNRAEEMLGYLYKNPGPLAKLSVKIKMDLPFFWLSKSENLILCGRIDWLEYLEKQDSVHIIDFKTGERKEKSGSLQLPIYYLLAANCQKRPVIKQSYWYLKDQTLPQEQKIMTYEEAEKQLLEIGSKMKTSRKLKKFNCPKNGCPYCRNYEKILSGDAELVGVSSYNVNLYLLNNKPEVKQPESIIL